MSAYIADGLVILGVVVLSIGVYGAIRMPDIYTRLHGASKSAFLGVISILVASFASGERGIVLRAILIIALLLVTTPVAAHAIARAAYRSGEPVSLPGTDETGEPARKR